MSLKRRFGQPPESIGEDLDPCVGEPDDKSLVIQATTYQLYLDLDNPKAINTFIIRLSFLVAKFSFLIDEWSCWESKTPGHFHVSIQLSESLEFEDRLFLQLYLGSDATKEFLSYLRKWEGYGEIVRLFLPGKMGTYAIYTSEGAEAPPPLIAAGKSGK